MNENVKLPHEPVAVEKVNPVVSVFYGATKVGKTAALAQLPDNLILDLERGAETYECLRVRIDNFEQFKNVMKQLKDGGNYKYVTVDTIDRLVEWLEHEVVKEWNEAQKRAKDPVTVRVYNEIPYGKGYDLVRLKMRAIMLTFRRYVPHVIFVGHLKRTLIGETTIEVKEDNLDLVGKLRNLVCADADAVGYMFRGTEGEKSALRISFKTSDNTAAGSRLNHLKGQLITLSTLENEEEHIYDTHWDRIFPA